MSIPTHNLYDFVHQVTENRYHLFYFYQWGNKELSNVIEYQIKELVLNQNPPTVDFQIVNKFIPDKYKDIGINFLKLTPIIFAHDQEPLNFDLYSDNNLDNVYKEKSDHDLCSKTKELNIKNVRPTNYWKKWILLHSEINSNQLKKYEETGEYVGAYWWSHALISRDWFRFANYDRKLNKTYNFKKKFLVYARDFTGSRSYRKNFLAKCKKNKLLDFCQTQSFNFKQDSSHLSAEYSSYDIVNTAFSVVLETVFDERIHLTEKTCRALATGHPFILANGPGALQYLKGYGFKTFQPWINESYDSEYNHDKRLKMIILEMQRLCSLDESTFYKTVRECYKVADHNKKLFFSDKFLNKINEQLYNNVEDAYTKTNYELNPLLLWLDLKYIKLNERKRYFAKDNKKKRIFMLKLILHLKKGGTIENYVPPDLD